MALMALMVGVHVEITYLRSTSNVDFHTMTEYEGWEVTSKRGEIVEVCDDAISIKPLGIPKRYEPGQYHLTAIHWAHIKMVEVIK